MAEPEQRTEQENLETREVWAREAMAAGCALLSGVMNTRVGCGGGCMPEVIELHPFRG